MKQKSKLSWLWTLLAVMATVAAVAGGIMVFVASKKKDDKYCWPDNEAYQRTNDAEWNKA